MPETNKQSQAALRVHVDTSLQIEQQKIQAQSEPVRRALAAYSFISTSTYALKEFKRAWLQDLNLIYSKSRDCKQIGDVYTAIQRALWHHMAKRRVQRCFDAINAFLEPHPTMPIGVAVLRLRAYLAEAILGGFKKWDRSVTHQYNGTGCIRAQEAPSRSPDGSIDCVVRHCRQSRIQCNVHSFFQTNAKSFLRINEAIERVGPLASAELKQTHKTITAATDKAEILCDSANCSAMSDALIAVDGLDADHYAANNPKEWLLLSNALGKTLINPARSLPDPPAANG